MGAMQKYFAYTFGLRCGIPSVTLLGEREDWEAILTKLEKIPQLGKETAQFTRLLESVLRHFVLSFDDPTSPDVKTFWGKCAHKQEGGSGPSYLSGWITAFCFWDEDGKCLFGSGPMTEARAGCDLHGVLFHKIDSEEIPNGFASVPVKVDDNGVIYRTTMVAGSVGISATSSGEMIDGTTLQTGGRMKAQISARTSSASPTATPSTSPPKVGTEEPGLDSLQPVSGWWMYVRKPDSVVQDREKEMKQIQEKLDEMKLDLSRKRPGEERTLRLRLRELKAF
jgi:hypothetical protein